MIATSCELLSDKTYPSSKEDHLEESNLTLMKYDTPWSYGLMHHVKLNLSQAYNSRFGLRMKPTTIGIVAIQTHGESDRSTMTLPTFPLCLFIYLFIGRESKRTYMTDVVKRDGRSMQYERVYVLHNI